MHNVKTSVIISQPNWLGHFIVHFTFTTARRQLLPQNCEAIHNFPCDAQHTLGRREKWLHVSHILLSVAAYIRHQQ